MDIPSRIARWKVEVELTINHVKQRLEISNNDRSRLFFFSRLTALIFFEIKSVSLNSRLDDGSIRLVLIELKEKFLGEKYKIFCLVFEINLTSKRLRNKFRWANNYFRNERQYKSDWTELFSSSKSTNRKRPTEKNILTESSWWKSNFRFRYENKSIRRPTKDRFRFYRFSDESFRDEKKI